MNKIRKRVEKCVRKALCVMDEVLLLRSTDLYADLGADSLDTIELLMALEAEFGIEIDETKEDVDAVRTIGGVVNMVKRALENP